MVLALALVLLTLSVPAAAAESCFAACLAGTPADAGDEPALRAAARTCKASCEAPARDALEQRGVLAVIERCRPEPLSADEFRAVRAASPSFQLRYNVFAWEVRNVLQGKVLRLIEVASPNLALQETRYTATALILPGTQGTFVIPDFYDGYPAVRYTTRIIEIGACPLP